MKTPARWSRRFCVSRVLRLLIAACPLQLLSGRECRIQQYRPPGNVTLLRSIPSMPGRSTGRSQSGNQPASRVSPSMTCQGSRYMHRLLVFPPPLISIATSRYASEIRLKPPRIKLHPYQPHRSSPNRRTPCASTLPASSLPSCPLLLPAMPLPPPSAAIVPTTATGSCTCWKRWPTSLTAESCSHPHRSNHMGYFIHSAFDLVCSDVPTIVAGLFVKVI